MKRLVGLLIIIIAIAAIVSYLARERIREHGEQDETGKSNGHRDDKELLREERVAPPFSRSA